mgnify:FL=1
MKNFYMKVLPSTGIYCVAKIDPSTTKIKHIFVETIDELVELVSSIQNTNIFIALANFEGHSRKADTAISFRSFFVDLDVGDEKGYDSKEEALESLADFVADNELPPPTVIDSGTGAHAYWFFTEDVPVAEWKVYADKFKDFCLNNGLRIDPVVTADISRILRCPDTFNHKTNPPTPTKVINLVDEPTDFDEWKERLGEVEVSLEEIVKREKISELGMKLGGRANYSSEFRKIVLKSLDEESDEGCPQIKHIVRNSTTLSEPLWYAGLSIAQHCTDRDTAIHILSKDYAGYSKEATERKADQTQDKPQSCATFNNLNPGVCESCKHFNKLTNPLPIGKIFVASPTTDTPVRSEIIPIEGGGSTVTTTLQGLPEELGEFKQGVNGGVIYKERPIFDENGDLVEGKEHLVTTYNLYALRRVLSGDEGECLLVKYDPPHDVSKEFYLPFSDLYEAGAFRKSMAYNGVLYDPLSNQWKYIMKYLVKWGEYLQAKGAADIMRTQMGWTPDYDAFVVGALEIDKEGKEHESPTSPLCRNVATNLKRSGSYDLWQVSANKLNTEGLEIHAFTMLAGFGSTLMSHTATSGVTLCLTGDTGAGKTAALNSALSIWGDPDLLSATQQTTTDNAMVGRYLALHNIPFGLDEVGNIDGKILSNLIHKISHGKAKLRMQASINAERATEYSAALVAMFTSNHSLYDKLSILKKDPNGEVARLIEIHIRKPQLFIDSPSTARQLFNPFKKNYGWAGPVFIKQVMKYSNEEIEAKVSVWVDRFKKDFGDDTAFRFYENLVAVTMVGGEIAAEADVVHIDLERIYKHIITEMIDIRENVVNKNEINYQSLVGEFINANNSNTLIVTAGHVTTEPKNTLVIRLDVDKRELCLSKAIFRKWLMEEKNVSPKQWMHQMNQSGTEVKEKRKKMAGNWKKGMDHFNVDAYIINIDTIDKEIIGVIEPEPA